MEKVKEQVTMKPLRTSESVSVEFLGFGCSAGRIYRLFSSELGEVLEPGGKYTDKVFVKNALLSADLEFLVAKALEFTGARSGKDILGARALEGRLSEGFKVERIAKGFRVYPVSTPKVVASHGFSAIAQTSEFLYEGKPRQGVLRAVLPWGVRVKTPEGYRNFHHTKLSQKYDEEKWWREPAQEVVILELTLKKVAGIGRIDMKTRDPKKQATQEDWISRGELLWETFIFGANRALVHY